MKKTIILNIEYLGWSKKIIRKIEFLEEQTLDDLHEFIIYKTFGWDDPHMYSFFMDNKPYSQNRKMEYASHPEKDFLTGSKPNSTETKLKDLNLKKGQRFLFLFDFGDDHNFNIKVEDFSESKEGEKYPKILEEIGKAPKQY